MNPSGTDEQARIDALKSFELLDTADEHIFDRLTYLAARICSTPMASISLIDGERQWFKSVIGLNFRETERAVSFCRQTILGRDPLVVPDARADPRFRDSPLVTGEAGIRFYAGAPLIASGGFAIGTLAVMDRVPREMDDKQLSILELLSEQVMIHIELRRQNKLVQGMAAEHEQMIDVLRRQARHLQEAQRIASIGSWELQPDSGALTCSNEVFRILGIAAPSGDMSFDAFLSFVHREDQQSVLAAREKSLRAHVPVDIEHRIRRPGGEIRHVHERAELSTDVHGRPVLAGTMQDVSSRHQAQQQLHLLESCVARLNDIVMITEAEPHHEPGPRIVFVNDAFEQLTGYGREEVLGRSPRMLQGPNTSRAELGRIAAALSGRQPITAELINYTKGGNEFWIEIAITPVADDSGRLTHFISIQRDITERRKKALELAHSNRALQMLSRCNEALIRAGEEQELLERVCRLAVDIGGYPLAWVAYVEHDAERSVKPAASAGAGNHAEEVASLDITWSEHEPTGCGPCGRAIRSGQAIVSEDIARDPSCGPWRLLTEERGYKGAICLPLRDGKATFGVLNLHTGEVRPIAADELKLLQEVADNLAFGISNIRSRREKQRLEATVLKVAAGVTASSGSAFFEQLVRNMAQALNADAALMAQFVPGEPLVVNTLSAVADGQALENFSYAIQGTPCELLLHQAYCFICEKARERFPLAQSLGTLDADAYIGVRLDDASGRPLGLLCVMFREPVTQLGFISSMLKIFAARAATELERQQADLHIRNQASLLDKARDAIMVCDTAGRLSFWNKGAERLYGWTREEVLGKSKGDLLYRDRSSFAESIQAVLRHGEWRGESENRCRDGKALIVEGHWTLVSDDRGNPVSIFAINTDITQRKADEKAIEQLAFFDPLTNLPNRRLLMNRLHHALASAVRNHRSGALLFIDLDNFKTLNDTFGHDKGDQLLTKVARRLERCVRKSNTVARLGGDEFVIMLEDLSAHPEEAAGQTETVGEKILAAFHQPFHLGEYEYHCTPSIGVALFGWQPDNVDELLKRADLAMYQAKAAGRNAIRFFDPEMQTLINARVALEADLRRSLQEHEFFLHYQPQIDGNGQVQGVEALVRWRHAQRGTIAPAGFIPLAEETGLIMKLGEWVLDTACRQLAKWALHPRTAHLSVAVNVSARQFRNPYFADQVLSILERTGAPPERLRLELTESLLLENLDKTISKMAALKDRGVGFSLDDFGTGYSSLSYLKRLPLDQLKIDQSFVRDIMIDANDAAITRTIVALGHNLGLEVVAEGVETEDQRSFLAQYGCHAYQGYLFSHPLPAERFS